MNSNGDNIFDKIQQQSGVDKNSIFRLADSVKDANFQDDMTVRQLVRQVALIAGRSVPKETEDQIVKAITSNNIPIDFATLNNMFDKK